jgi:hypothetical protein
MPSPWPPGRASRAIGDTRAPSASSMALSPMNACNSTGPHPPIDTNTIAPKSGCERQHLQLQNRGICIDAANQPCLDRSRPNRRYARTRVPGAWPYPHLRDRGPSRSAGSSAVRWPPQRRRRLGGWKQPVLGLPGAAWGCGRRPGARRRIAGGRVPAAPVSIGPRQGKSQLICSAHAVASAGSGLRAIAARQGTRDDSRRHAGRPSPFSRSRQTSVPRKPAERAKPLVTMVIGEVFTFGCDLGGHLLLARLSTG